MITFEDGSTLEAEDWGRILQTIKQRAKDGKPKPTEIKSGGVTVKTANLDPHANGGVPAYAKYMEIDYKQWKVRVWRVPKDKVYGCNVFKGEQVYYLEYRFQDCHDENDVFKYAKQTVDQLIAQGY